MKLEKQINHIIDQFNQKSTDGYKASPIESWSTQNDGIYYDSSFEIDLDAPLNTQKEYERWQELLTNIDSILEKQSEEDRIASPSLYVRIYPDRGISISMQEAATIATNILEAVRNRKK